MEVLQTKSDQVLNESGDQSYNVDLQNEISKDYTQEGEKSPGKGTPRESNATSRKNSQEEEGPKEGDEENKEEDKEGQEGAAEGEEENANGEGRIFVDHRRTRRA